MRFNGELLRGFCEGSHKKLTGCHEDQLELVLPHGASKDGFEEEHCSTHGSQSESGSIPSPEEAAQGVQTGYLLAGTLAPGSLSRTPGEDANPVEAAKGHRLSIGTTGGYGELPFALCSGMIEGA